MAHLTDVAEFSKVQAGQFHVLLALGATECGGGGAGRLGFG